MEKEEMKKIVGSLVGVILRDKTKPDMENLQSGWETNDCFGKLESTFVGNSDPGTYYEICRRVMSRVKNASEAKALAWINMFNGKRRLTRNAELDRSLRWMAKKIEGLVFKLPDGTRKYRCVELYNYNVSVFYNNRGLFLQAAKAQEKAGEIAKNYGHEAGASICLFMAAVYHFKQTMFEGATQDDLLDLFMMIGLLFDKLVVNIRHTSLEVRWVTNAAVHMIETCTWLGWQHHVPRWDEWLKLVYNGAEILGGPWKNSAAFVHAIDKEKQGAEDADCALNSVVNGNCHTAENVATVLLVMARGAKKEYKLAIARNFVNQISDDDSARHVRAIAERELASSAKE